MPLGTEVGLGSDDIVLDGDAVPLPKKGAEPPSQFSTHVYCGQTAGLTKIPLGTKIGVGPGDIVRWGSSSPKRGGEPPNFRPMSVVWPNGWTDQDGTWYEGGIGSGDIVLHGDPASPKRATAPQFLVHVYCGQTVAHLSYCGALVKVDVPRFAEGVPKLRSRCCLGWGLGWA